jgi:S1-C subfamily serine protease
MGIEMESLTPSLQQQYGFSVASGAVIMSVISGTPAASAGLLQGDIIVGINGTTIGGGADVQLVISSHHPGDVITISIVRGTKHLSIKLTLGTKPTN